MEVLSYTTSGADSPTMNVTIYMDVFRNKENISIRFDFQIYKEPT